MSKRHEEIARFHQGGKTFFFNKGQARNGNEYLSVKTLWGKGNQEQLVLFPGQMVDFYKKFTQSMEEITGLSPGGGVAESAPPQLPRQCPDCEAHYGAFEVHFPNGNGHWQVYCDECRYVVFDSEGSDD